MNHLGKSYWKRWTTFWEVIFIFLVGMFLFAILYVVSAGLVITLAMAGACFIVLASIHYLLWGRGFSWAVLPERHDLESRSPAAGDAAHLDDFVVELNDSERKELMELVQHSLADAAPDAKTTAVRRELLNKLRMFGA
jgi:hypothetical protein